MRDAVLCKLSSTSVARGTEPWSRFTCASSWIGWSSLRESLVGMTIPITRYSISFRATCRMSRQSLGFTFLAQWMGQRLSIRGVPRPCSTLASHRQLLLALRRDTCSLWKGLMEQALGCVGIMPARARRWRRSLPCSSIRSSHSEKSRSAIHRTNVTPQSIRQHLRPTPCRRLWNTRASPREKTSPARSTSPPLKSRKPLFLLAFHEMKTKCHKELS